MPMFIDEARRLSRAYKDFTCMLCKLEQGKDNVLCDLSFRFDEYIEVFEMKMIIDTFKYHANAKNTNK